MKEFQLPKSSLQTRAGQRSITANLRLWTAHIYHVMIIVTGGFSNKYFFYQYYFYFREILLNSLELVFLEFKHIYKTQRTSLFSFYLLIFYLLFHNHSAYQCPPPLRLFRLCVNTKDESVLFLIVVSQSLHVISGQVH